MSEVDEARNKAIDEATERLIIETLEWRDTLFSIADDYRKAAEKTGFFNGRRIKPEMARQFWREFNERAEAISDMEKLIKDTMAKLKIELGPDEVSFWYMYDDHSYGALTGSTLEEVLEHANRRRNGEDGSYGMLCEATLLKNGKEVRRVKVDYTGIKGVSGCHAGKPGKAEDDQRWRETTERWLAAHKTDPDVVRLVAAGKCYKPSTKGKGE